MRKSEPDQDAIAVNEYRSTLFYIHDPMCSWCWGYRPTWQKLKSALPDACVISNVVGGLAPDNDTPMPVEMQKSIEGYWRKIEAMLGTRFNYNFWTECEPRRDTYKACRAVLVAARHGLEEDMILAIQQAYYLNAKNPSNIETLVDLATEMNLDGPDFRLGLQSEETEVQFKQQRALAQRLGVNGFPTLRLKIENSIYPVTLDYNDHSVSLKEIEKISRLQ